KERVLSSGVRVRLELAVADPRSLMQGDYMTLRYALGRDIDLDSDEGMLALDLDGNDVASLSRGEGDAHMVYRVRGRSRDVRLGTDGFYFEEGQASAYATARYAEFRVDERGESVLVGLLDERFVRLGGP
ncbi:MAG: GDYXXLXY domain-containing protein, partial [Deltaproteobacteria bacterium]|nr:GDYXXLXY domain-containing protein [Deltaproteobacteria bacterium]